MIGLRYRNYYCIINESDGLYVDNTKCNNSVKPNGTEECYKTKGCKPHWVPLEWTKVMFYLNCCTLILLLILINNFSVAQLVAKELGQED